MIKVSEENKTKTCVPPTERPTVLTQEVTIRVTGLDPGIWVGSGYFGRIRVFWSDPGILVGSGSVFNTVRKQVYRFDAYQFLKLLGSGLS